MENTNEPQTQANTPIPDNLVEVKKPILEEGTVQFMNKAAFRGRTPENVKRVVKAIQTTLVALSGLVAATDLFSGNQSKAIIFILLVAAAVTEGIGKAVGVETVEDKKNKES